MIYTSSVVLNCENVSTLTSVFLNGSFSSVSGAAVSCRLVAKQSTSEFAVEMFLAE